MQVSGLGANPLLSMGLRASSAPPAVFSAQRANAAISAAAATNLPPVQPVQLSLDMLMTLQGEQAESAVTEAKPPSAADLFLQEARKSPMERMREQVMKSLGVTEDDLAKMPADEKRAMEDKIREMIEEKLKQGMRENGAPADAAGDVVLEAALA